MPKKCKDLANEVTVDGNVYKKKNKPSEPTYTYYREPKDPDGDPFNVHFTVVNTGGGEADFDKFHVTFDIDGSNAKFNYTKGQPEPKVKDDTKNLPSHKREIWDQQIAPHKDDYDELARKFWEKLNQ